MHKHLVRYLVSSPDGDISVDNNMLNLPLEGDPLKTPYRIYFQSIKNFLIRKDYTQLLSAAKENFGREIHSEEIGEIIIRAEKHGALYHPASLEMILKERILKFGLLVAVSEEGRTWLKKEFSVIQKINAKFKMAYLPKVFFFDEENAMSFLLEEWFEGYHEFHLSINGKGEQLIKLWEFGKGYKYLSSEQSFEIYKKASKILTLYYDINEFSQIYPWHHAAGDFIVRVKDGKTDVRLTTARQYEPYMTFQYKEGINPVIALFYFLLHLTIRMRLDKLDGVGDTVWAEDFCLDAAIKGFFEGLRFKNEMNNYLGSEDEFLRLLKSFRPEDLKTAYTPLIDLYKGTADYPVITANLDRHVKVFYAILQNSPS